MRKLWRSATLLSTLALALGGASAAQAQNVYHTPLGVAAHSTTFGLAGQSVQSFAQEALRATAPITTVEQFDTVTLSTMPANPAAVAGYTSGFWPTFLPLVHAFPHALHISIAINAAHVADCLDVEPGDAVPSQTGSWVVFDRQNGVQTPCVYTSLSEMSQVKANLAAVLGASWRSQVRLWDANWTFVAHLDPGYDCTQWTDRAFNSNLDESTCARSFYGPVPPADPYAVLDHTLRHFANGVTAREYNTVKTWDTAHCQNPVKRAVCRTTHSHLQLLAGRLWKVSHRHAHANWSDHRGIRFHILWTRVQAPSRRCFHGPVTFTSCP